MSRITNRCELDSLGDALEMGEQTVLRSWLRHIQGAIVSGANAGRTQEIFRDVPEKYHDNIIEEFKSKPVTITSRNVFFGHEAILEVKWGE